MSFPLNPRVCSKLQFSCSCLKQTYEYAWDFVDSWSSLCFDAPQNSTDINIHESEKLPKPNWFKRNIFNFRQKGLFYGSKLFEFISRMLNGITPLVEWPLTSCSLSPRFGKNCLSILYVDRNIFFSWFGTESVDWWSSKTSSLFSLTPRRTEPVDEFSFADMIYSRNFHPSIACECD